MRSTVTRMLIFVLCISAFICGITGFIYYLSLESKRDVIKTREADKVNLLKKTITGDLKFVVSDLMILSNHYELKMFLEDGNNERKANLVKLFVEFAEQRMLYHQIRFINEKGMEVVRVNYDGVSVVVPDDKLQNKSNRYYFTDAVKLAKGEIYVSPFDLNIEHGGIERPLRPMIRFCSPVLNKNGLVKGVIVLNYLGERLISDFESGAAGLLGKPMILNKNGFWIYAGNPDVEWAFMYDDRKDLKFGSQFPEAWAGISKTETGQFLAHDGLFTFATVHPILDQWEKGGRTGKWYKFSIARLKLIDNYWKIVSYVPRATLNMGYRKLAARLLAMFFAVAALLYALSLYFCPVYKNAVRKWGTE